LHIVCWVLYFDQPPTPYGSYKKQTTTENTAKNHTNTGWKMMWKIFSDIITIGFSLHLK